MSDRVRAWRGDGASQPTVPVSVVSQWQTLHTAPESVDAGWRSAAGLIDAADREVLEIGGFGTTALLRLVYPAGAAVGVIARLHGGTGDSWHSLRDADGERDVQLPVDPTGDDQLPGGMQATQPVALDAEGTDRLVIGIASATDGSGASIQVKII